MADILPFPSRPRLPGPRDRVAVIGRTGSGKTHFACWLLSQADYDKRPWIIVDYKADELIGEIPHEQIDINPRRLPIHPGLYRVEPKPSDTDAVESLLTRIWQRKRIGVYIDEGHMLPDKGGLQTLLTQGRSRSIPVICLTQRPSWVNRFVFSEADFFAVFHLNDRRDRQTIGSFMPERAAKAGPLPEYHSWYYDIGRNHLTHLLPAPSRDEIIATFEARHPTRMKKGFV